MLSTAEDLFKWNQALVTNQLLSKKLIFTNTTLNNNSETNYSYGWAINTINNSSTIEHSGGTFGYATYATYLLEEDIFVTVLSNCDCKEPRVVTTKIAAICIDKPLPFNESAITLNSSDLNKFVGTYLFDDNSIRIVTLEGNQLSFNFPDGNASKLFSVDGTTFWIDGTTENMTFMKSTKGMNCLFKNRIYESKGSRQDQ